MGQEEVIQVDQEIQEEVTQVDQEIQEEVTQVGQEVLVVVMVVKQVEVLTNQLKVVQKDNLKDKMSLVVHNLNKVVL